jgi:sigma-E factor negative regulatory protein RseC
MQEQEKIEHIGIVQSIEDKYINVSITSASACSGCHASGVCDVSGTEQKVIRAINSGDISIGETVMVVMEKSLGFRALFIGYLLPFLIVMSLLILMSSLSFSEPVSGIIALLSLAPYYGVVYLKKEKIGQRFSFTIKKLNR